MDVAGSFNNPVRECSVIGPKEPEEKSFTVK